MKTELENLKRLYGDTDEESEMTDKPEPAVKPSAIIYEIWNQVKKLDPENSTPQINKEEISI